MIKQINVDNTKWLWIEILEGYTIIELHEANEGGDTLKKTTTIEY